MRQLISNIGTDYAALFVTGIAILIVTLIYLWWNDQNQGKLSVPGLSSTDEVYGNLNQITKDGGLHQFLSDNHKKFGPMFSFFWGKELVVSLGSPYVWKDCQTLFDRPIAQFTLFKPLIGEYSIQYMNTPHGQKFRKLLDRHYSFSAIGLYYNKFIEIGNELVNKWKQLPKEEMIPLRQHMIAVALKSIIKTSFGNDYFKTNKDILEFQAAYIVCWNEMESGLGGDICEPGSDRQKDFDKALKSMKEKVIEIVNHRRAKKEKDDSSLIDVMVEADDLFSSDQQIFDTVITYIVGGFHTTGNLLVWAVYYLCKHPKVVERMLKEIDEVLGENEIKKDDIDKLVYVKQVVDESMRCSVLAPFAARFSEYDLIVGGHLIPKQTPLVFALGSVLQDENIFPEPKNFDPDRFGPNAPKRHPLSYQPFGFAGKRKCPGYRFAYYESIVFLVAIVRNFKISLVSDDDAIPVHGIVTSPKEEIYVTIEKR